MKIQAGMIFAGFEASIDSLLAADFSLQIDEGEMRLVKLIAQYPRVIEAAAAAPEPHRVAFYLHDLASSWSSHRNKGLDQPQLRFVNEESPELTIARLALAGAVTSVLESGLGILGVNVPDERTEVCCSQNVAALRGERRCRMFRACDTDVAGSKP